jgi:hypothetical protein
MFVPVVITRQLQAAEVLSKLSTINGKSSFVNAPVVITKQLVITTQLELYFNNSSRIPTNSGLQKNPPEPERAFFGRRKKTNESNTIATELGWSRK